MLEHSLTSWMRDSMESKENNKKKKYRTMKTKLLKTKLKKIKFNDRSEKKLKF